MKVVLTDDTTRLDTLHIMHGTFRISINGAQADTSVYRINEADGLLIWLGTLPTDSLEISYRTWPAYISRVQARKSKDLISTRPRDTFKPYLAGSSPRDAVFDQSELQKGGSISRGILFGNSQNLSVNSNLNLQLSGKLNERFNLLASVTDDNIPIQPQGNTQQLQDFDQVFIQIYDEHTKLIAGDFILRRPQGYFMNYFKRAQGAYVQHISSLKKKDGKETTIPVKLSVDASASVSKGRFARNTIQGVEGNQGPYRLTGADGELFIIVLAGTEQVYIDGRLLQRGLDKDYVIDYNAAEITFTPRQFITKDRRIAVEFQYSEKRYARPLLQTAVCVERGHNKYYLNAYSENDAKNQPLQQELTQTDKQILALAGDDLLSATRSGIDSVGYSNNTVLYALTDSLGYDSVFVFSTDSSLAKYRLTFTPVGNGNGNYVEDGFSANGRKYKWVKPLEVDGVEIKQGNFEPVVLLATPKKNQMLVLGMHTKTESARNQNINHEWMAEGAISNRDLNTFSSLDAADDVGFALRAKWKREKTMVSGFSKFSDTSQGRQGAKLTRLTAIGYEYTSSNFAPIERFREVEFARNWNALQLNLANDQHIAQAEAGIHHNAFGSVSLGTDAFLLGDSYEGYKGKISTRILTEKQWRANLDASYLYTKGQIKTQFLRHKSDISKHWKYLRLYFRDEHEHNLFYQNNSDTLAGNTYQFYDWEAGIGTADTLNKSFTIYYRDRIDRRLQTTDLSNTARADQYGALITVRGKKDSRLHINISNRRLRVINPELFTQAPENTLLTRLEYNFKWKDGFLQSTTFYEVGSGLEQKREFIYLEVPAGQGIYVWIDYDADGNKDLNEFEVAQFIYEANYIRSSVQSNEYARVFSNQFSQSVQLNPSRVLKKKSKLNTLINRFSSQSSFRADRKTTRENKNDRFNSFLTEIADSTLLSLNGMFRNIVFFNKANPYFGLDYTHQYSRNKSLLSNGFESRGDAFQQLGVRLSFLQSFTFFVECRNGNKVASSDFLSGRNFEITYLSIQPRFTWQPDNTSRLNLTAQFTQKTNVTGLEQATIQKLGSDITLNSVEKGSVIAELNYFRIAYTGENNNSLSFEMLEGLGKGNNFTWSATVQRTVAKNLQLNLTYNGRKPETVRTIHSGGIQLRAFF